MGNDGKIFAADVHEISLDILRREIEEKNILNIEPLLTDITNTIPIDNASIDVYFTANVFHGIVGNDEIDSTMKEITRVLKDDGVLAIVEFIKVEGTPGPPMDIRLEPQEVMDNISNYGFEKKIVKKTGPYHYLLLASKK